MVRKMGPTLSVPGERGKPPQIAAACLILTGKWIAGGRFEQEIPDMLPFHFLPWKMHFSKIQSWQPFLKARCKTKSTVFPTMATNPWDFPLSQVQCALSLDYEASVISKCCITLSNFRGNETNTSSNSSGLISAFLFEIQLAWGGGGTGRAFSGMFPRTRSSLSQERGPGVSCSELFSSSSLCQQVF